MNFGSEGPNSSTVSIDDNTFNKFLIAYILSIDALLKAPGNTSINTSLTYTSFI